MGPKPSGSASVLAAVSTSSCCKLAVPRVARRWGFVRPVGLVLGGALAGVALMLVVIRFRHF